MDKSAHKVREVNGASGNIPKSVDFEKYLPEIGDFVRKKHKSIVKNGGALTGHKLEYTLYTEVVFSMLAVAICTDKVRWTIIPPCFQRNSVNL